MHTKRLLIAAALAALLVLAGLWAPGPQATPAARAADPHTTRQGAWLDSLVFTELGSASDAVDRLQADELDVYAYSVSDSDVFQRVLEDPSLTYTEAFGSYNELTFNPAGPQFYDGRLNPFSNAAIRAAMNRLIDRDYLAQELFGGMATPMFTSLLPSLSADYQRYLTTVEAIEADYAYDLAQAQAAIGAEMVAMGAYLQDGTWTYDGAPVTLIAIIRTEDLRRQIGDYVSDQLEAIGFTVDRQYKTRSQASPIWNQSDPWEGQWHVYTGGWITTAVSRDDATNFGYFYTNLGSGSPLWQNYDPTPEFLDVAGRLWTDDFSTPAERDALFEQVLPMAMDDAGVAPPEGAGSLRVWLVNQRSFSPQRADVVLAADRAGGVEGSSMFPYVARFEGAEGGDLRVAQPGLLVEPWNPVAGSNWTYDQMPIRATRDVGLLADPDTGLYWPQRIESAACVVKEGLPVGKTLDWITLSTAPVVEVPAGAWADWDAAAQTFIAAGDMPTPTLEANAKCTVTYPDDLFTTVTWHDGSPLDLSDFVLSMIMTFDMGKPESAIYDEALAPRVEAFLSHFRGVVIESTDPLVITTYDDLWYLDAEWMVRTWWPNYSQGPAAWHNLTPAIRAEEAGQLAFSTDKAGKLGVPWTDFLSGDSLDIMEAWMNQSASEHYIPYLPTMGSYVTQAEADARWLAIQAWYAARGHFWVGTGPFYVEQVSYDPKSLTLARFDGFVDPAGKWDAFAADAMPEVILNYESGAPGSYFNVTGSGFPPGETAFVVVNDTVIGEVQVDGSGAVAFTLGTGDADPGEYHMRVSVNPAAGAAFTLDQALPVLPREGELPLVEVPDGLIWRQLHLPLLMRSWDPTLLFFDDFSDPGSGWSQSCWYSAEGGEGDPCTFWASYTQGEYELGILEPGWVMDQRAPIDPMSGAYSVEADARRVSGSDTEYGIGFDNDDSWFAYWFVVQPETQGYKLWSIIDEYTWNVLAEGTSAYIQAGDATNHLRAERNGAQIVISVNGHELASLTDSSHQGGYLKAQIWSHAGAPATARFDNFEVHSLGSGLGGPPPRGPEPLPYHAIPIPPH